MSRQDETLISRRRFNRAAAAAVGLAALAPVGRLLAEPPRLSLRVALDPVPEKLGVMIYLRNLTAAGLEVPHTRNDAPSVYPVAAILLDERRHPLDFSDELQQRAMRSRAIRMRHLTLAAGQETLFGSYRSPWPEALRAQAREGTQVTLELTFTIGGHDGGERWQQAHETRLELALPDMKPAPT